MSRLVFSLFIALLIPSCSSPRLAASISAEERAAMSQLHVGMTEDAARALMKPVALDSGRVTWGGSGSGLLYFQVSPSQQFCLEVGAGPEFNIIRVGNLEPKRRWIRDSRGNMSVE